MASKFAEDFAKKHIPSSQMGLRARVSQALDSAMEEYKTALKSVSERDVQKTIMDTYNAAPDTGSDYLTFPCGFKAGLLRAAEIAWKRGHNTLAQLIESEAAKIEGE